MNLDAAQKTLYILRMSIVAKAYPPCDDKTPTTGAESRPHRGEFFRGYIRIPPQIFIPKPRYLRDTVAFRP